MGGSLKHAISLREQITFRSLLCQYSCQNRERTRVYRQGLEVRLLSSLLAARSTYGKPIPVVIQAAGRILSAA